MNTYESKTGFVAMIKQFSYLLALLGLNLSLFISALVMAGLSLAGMWKFGTAVYAVFVKSAVATEEDPIHTALSGLEFLFLAPLAYFVTWNALKYMTAIAPFPVEGEKETAQGDGAPKRESRLWKARAEMLMLKAFNVSLFIAITSTYLVGKMLSKEGITYENVFCGSIVIIIMGIYFFMLERASMHLSEKAIGQKPHSRAKKATEEEERGTDVPGLVPPESE